MNINIIQCLDLNKHVCMQWIVMNQCYSVNKQLMQIQFLPFFFTNPAWICQNVVCPRMFTLGKSYLHNEEILRWFPSPYGEKNTYGRCEWNVKCNQPGLLGDWRSISNCDNNYKSGRKVGGDGESMKGKNVGLLVFAIACMKRFTLKLH